MEIGIQVIDWLIPHEWGTEIVIPSVLWFSWRISRTSWRIQ